MGDQQQAENTEAVEEIAQDDSTRPESNNESEVPTEETQEETDDTSSSREQEGGDTEEKKSRYERRVDKLVSKLKAQSENKATEASSDIFGDEPLVRPEDYENGLSEQELEQRLMARSIQEKEQIKRELKAEAEYERNVADHIADIDSVQSRLGDNKDLDYLVAQQYEALNYLTDPRTGQTVFIPRVKMSEIYAKLERVIDKKSTQAAADVSGKLADQIGEQAVPSSVSSNSNPDLEGQAAFEKASSTGRDEDWAEVLKRRLSK